MNTTKVAKELFSKYVEIFSKKDAEDTSKGKETQRSEKIYTELFEMLLLSEGYTEERKFMFTPKTYSKASSQKPYDFRICTKNCSVDDSIESYLRSMEKEESIEKSRFEDIDTSNELLLLEMKKTDAQQIMLNDTIPHDNSWYIILENKKITKKNKNRYLRLVSGKELKNAWTRKAIEKGSEITTLEEYDAEMKIVGNKLNHIEYPRKNITIPLKYIHIDAVNSFKEILN